MFTKRTVTWVGGGGGGRRASLLLPPPPLPCRTCYCTSVQFTNFVRELLVNIATVVTTVQVTQVVIPASASVRIVWWLLLCEAFFWNSLLFLYTGCTQVYGLIRPSRGIGTNPYQLKGDTGTARTYSCLTYQYYHSWHQHRGN
jgi:hypothetical protein